MNRTQHFTSPGLLALLATAVALAGCGDADVVAKVGKAKLRRADLEAYQHGALRDADAAAKALDALVDRTLLAEAARKAGLDDDAAIKARIEASRREILASAYSERLLAPATREDALRKRYEAQQEKLARRRVHVRQISVLFGKEGGGGKKGAQARAVRIYARLVGGEPFEKVAQDASDDQVSGVRGGDIGPVLEGQIDPNFFQAVAGLKKDQLSQPFETSFAFHLARAVDDPDTVTPTFEQARGQLAADASREAQGRLREELRQKLGVTLYPEALTVVPSGSSPRK